MRDKGGEIWLDSCSQLWYQNVYAVKHYRLDPTAGVVIISTWMKIVIVLFFGTKKGWSYNNQLGKTFAFLSLSSIRIFFLFEILFFTIYGTTVREWRCVNTPPQSRFLFRVFSCIRLIFKFISFLFEFFFSYQGLVSINVR